MELSPRLMAAFDRLAKGPPPIPNWPRCVRIGVDYPVQVTANDIETDQQADALSGPPNIAHICRLYACAGTRTWAAYFGQYRA
jgi:hypothetical protein